MNQLIQNNKLGISKKKEDNGNESKVNGTPFSSSETFEKALSTNYSKFSSQQNKQPNPSDPQLLVTRTIQASSID